MNNPKKINITHIITGLKTGGAENVLLQVILGMDKSRFENTVISLTGRGAIAERIEQSGSKLITVNFSKSIIGFLSIFALRRAIKISKPDIVQTWMYHSDFIGGLLARLVTHAPVLWNLRQSNLDKTQSNKTTIWIAKMCAKISTWCPSTIVCGSYSARETHTKINYNSTIMQVLPNGFDHNYFQPDPAVRETLLGSLQLDRNAILIGLPARFHPQKDHKTFFKAAALLHTKYPNIHFLLSGDGIDNDNLELINLYKEFNINACIHIMGELDDMRSYYPGLDLTMLTSSFGEGAPNILGEAMSCGIPCVATDIGDSGLIIGDTGKTVPAQDPQSLFQAVTGLLELPKAERNNLGLLARQRIIETFQTDFMVKHYEELYCRVHSQHY